MVTEDDRSPDDGHDAHEQADGSDRSKQSTPTKSGHSTARDQTRRNQEDESPS